MSEARFNPTPEEGSAKFDSAMREATEGLEKFTKAFNEHHKNQSTEGANLGYLKDEYLRLLTYINEKTEGFSEKFDVDFEFDADQLFLAFYDKANNVILYLILSDDTVDDKLELNVSADVMFRVHEHFGLPRFRVTMNQLGITSHNIEENSPPLSFSKKNTRRIQSV